MGVLEGRTENETEAVPLGICVPDAVKLEVMEADALPISLGDADSETELVTEEVELALMHCVKLEVKERMPD